MDESHANQLYNSTELNSSSIESQTYLEYIGYNHKRLPRGYWKKKENHKKYIEWLGKKLGYTTMEHWYKISTKDYKNNYGNRLLTYYNHSYVKLVTSMYPEYNWIIWKFKVVPNSYWQNKENHTKYMDWLGKKLGYTTKDDWYNISVVKDITDNDGGGLLKYYNHSYVKLVTSMYPEYNWIIWKFKVVPKNYWQNKENHIKYMDWLGKELGYTTKDDWYNISTKDVKNNYGDGLLMAYYNSSSIELVTSIYPDYNWIIWKFKFVTNNYWKNKENHTKYIEWLGKGLGYTTMEDWYKISQKDFKNNYGGGLLTYYNGSSIDLVTSMYPEHNWIIWKFKFVTNNYWKNKENHKKYIEWLGKELGYTTMEDWYNISVKSIHNNYGCGLLRYYNGSNIELVTSMYPEHNWIIWKFKYVTNNYWQNKENHTKYIEWLGKELGYTTMEDWYKISQKDLKNNYGGGLLNKYYNGSPSQLVIKMFPDYNWDKSKFINYKTEALTHNFLSNNKCKLGIVNNVYQT